MGWWRRNRWGLIGLIPALAAVLALSAERVSILRDLEPTAVTADEEGWYHLEQARMRLVSLAPVTDLRTYTGEPFTLAPQAAAWVARIEFEAEGDSAIGGCDVSIEDDRGRVFAAYQAGGFALLAGTRDTISQGCLSDAGLDERDSRYVSASYFVLPRGGRPVAIRIAISGEPLFVRLPVG